MSQRTPWGSGCAPAVVSGSAPTVSAISPSSGTTAGGDAVTITGTNFIAGATATIGGAAVTSLVVVSGTSITAVTPSGSAGAAQDVIVTTSNGSGTGSGLYTYTAAIVFHSDWTTTTKTDGGKWTYDGDAGHTLLSVVSASSEGVSTNCPSTNVLKVAHSRSGTSVFSGSVGLASGAWTSPQVGDKRFLRWYEYFAIPDTEGDCTTQPGGTNSHHPHENGNGQTDESWEVLWAPKADGTVNWRFNSVVASSKWDLTSGSGVLAYLTKSAWYRFEISFQRTGTNAYTLDIRIYNAAGSLVFDKTNLRDANGLSTTLATKQSGSPGWFTMTDANIDQMQFGTNGGSCFQALSTTRYSYVAAVCLRSDDWCGAYSGGI